MTAAATLAESLRSFSLERGADLFGVAELAPAREAVLAQGGPLVASFPRAVSLGMLVSDEILDAHRPEESPRDSVYWHHVYGVVTPSLDVVANDVVRWLTRRGHRALAVPASMPYDTERLQGKISHKLAAHLAGLGWIGKSSLLVTDAYGPRVRFVTVLTDAALETGAAVEGRCGKCTSCVEACPVSAFTGAEFDPADELTVRFDTRRCHEYRKTHACGLCVARCPKGTERAERRRAAHAARAARPS